MKDYFFLHWAAVTLLSIVSVQINVYSSEPVLYSNHLKSKDYISHFISHNSCFLGVFVKDPETDLCLQLPPIDVINHARFCEAITVVHVLSIFDICGLISHSDEHLVSGCSLEDILEQVRCKCTSLQFKVHRRE